MASIASRLSRPLLQATSVTRHCSTIAFVKRKVTLDYAVFSANASNIDLSPIVVSHGVLGNKKEWEVICKELNAFTGRKVISYDAVNHGGSPHHNNMSYHDMAIDLVELLEKLNISKQVSCVGHRMGGKTGMILALTQPERVEQLVVIDTAPCVRHHDIMGENTTEVLQQLSGINLKAFKSRDELVEIIDEMSIFPRLHRAVLTNLTEIPDGGGMRWAINLDALFNNYSAILSFPPFHEEVTFTGPSLFLLGNEGLLSCDNDRPSITKRFPSAQLEFLAERGDYDFNPHKSKPQDMLHRIKDFLV